MTDLPAKALPCPMCGSENIVSNEWTVDGEHAEKFGADEHSEIWAFECQDCLCSAPVETWQNRRSPWRTDEPEPGQRILATYRDRDGIESLPTVYTYIPEYERYLSPRVRWMPIPDIS